MKNLSKKVITGLLICVSFLFGDMVRKTYFSPDTTEKTIVLTDNLPLANQGSIKIELVDGKKLVIFSLEDLKYISKKKKIMRTTVENLESLFKRLEE